MFYDPFLITDDGGIISTVLRWLHEEGLVQLGTAVADSWAVQTWTLTSAARFPRQADSSDCGVFSLVISDCLAAGATPPFTQRSVPALRRLLVLA